MTRTSLDDAHWASLMLAMQQIPRVWKRDEAALRRFVEAALWIGRTGAPWRDLPDALGCWASIYHRWRRWCVRGWWGLVFEALRPSLPADGLVLIDSTTCSAKRCAFAHGRNVPQAVPPTARLPPKRSAAAGAACAPSFTPASMARATSFA